MEAKEIVPKLLAAIGLVLASCAGAYDYGGYPYASYGDYSYNAFGLWLCGI
jgi:hypothetical protein